jgi:hypothetical protein
MQSNKSSLFGDSLETNKRKKCTPAHFERNASLMGVTVCVCLFVQRYYRFASCVVMCSNVCVSREPEVVSVTWNDGASSRCEHG